MAKPKGKGENDEGDIDALFKLPLSEFTAARNALATRLKKAGDRAEADRVKSLPKPSVPAWAVNQLYWKHRGLFDRLIATGERFRQVHASQIAGSPVDVREPLAERREVLSTLAGLADALLREAGHNPTTEVMRRISSTLEALSTESSVSDASHAGRLSEDINPPGFESLAGIFQNVVLEKPASRPTQPSPEVPQAKAALEAAERTLRDVRSRSNEVAAAIKEAAARVDQTEKLRREIEQQLEKATAAVEQAHQHLERVKAEAEETARLLKDAELAVDKARREIES
jgi:hypothetical protein